MKSNKRIFITGGASGLGKAIAMHYAKQGFNVAIGDINEDNLEITKQALLKLTKQVMALPCNTTKFKDLENAQKTIENEWGGLDILVNNAGIAGTVGEVEKVSMANWDQVLNINLLGVVRGCKAFNALFKRQGSGAIVNIASMAGITNTPQLSIYNSSKAAVISLTETLRYELKPFNVNAHVVCPAFFKTNLIDSMESSDKTKSFVTREMEKSSITADDIAAMIERQIENNDLYLLPHKRERNLWLLKRFFPTWYERKAMQMYKKLFGHKG